MYFRFAACLALDHIAVLYPEVDSPFMDKIDVVNRLLPYHVFQHPKADLDGLLKGGKRKEKFADNHLFKEIKGALCSFVSFA
jgi:hypothetical protein